jgi:hypothetical protein
VRTSGNYDVRHIYHDDDERPPIVGAKAINDMVRSTLEEKYKEILDEMWQHNPSSPGRFEFSEPSKKTDTRGSTHDATAIAMQMPEG